MPIFKGSWRLVWPIWPDERAKFEKNGFLTISHKRFVLEQKCVLMGPLIFATFGGVTETTFSSKMNRFGLLAHRLFQQYRNSVSQPFFNIFSKFNF